MTVRDGAAVGKWKPVLWLNPGITANTIYRSKPTRNLNVSTVVTVLFMMVSGGSAGGFLLKSTIISTVLSVQLQVVKTAPDSQLFNLLSVSKLVTVLNEADRCGVVCKLQELDRGVL